MTSHEWVSWIVKPFEVGLFKVSNRLLPLINSLRRCEGTRAFKKAHVPLAPNCLLGLQAWVVPQAAYAYRLFDHLFRFLMMLFDPYSFTKKSGFLRFLFLYNFNFLGIGRRSFTIWYFLGLFRIFFIILGLGRRRILGSIRTCYLIFLGFIGRRSLIKVSIFSCFSH